MLMGRDVLTGSLQTIQDSMRGKPVWCTIPFCLGYLTSTAIDSRLACFWTWSPHPTTLSSWGIYAYMILEDTHESYVHNKCAWEWYYISTCRFYLLNFSCKERDITVCVLISFLITDVCWFGTPTGYVYIWAESSSLLRGSLFITEGIIIIFIYMNLTNCLFFQQEDRIFHHLPVPLSPCQPFLAFSPLMCSR